MEITIQLSNLHPAQKEILRTAKRFNVLKCGRRFGKTEIAKELVIDPALDGLPTAYFAPTYKDLDVFWTELKWIVHDIIQTKNETTKRLKLITGGSIDMWSLEDPDSGRGRKYKRVVIDECEKAKKLKEAWQGSIRPTLTDYKGDCWFLSTPKFGDTFFKEIYRWEKDPKYAHEWQSWRYSTYDNPYIDPKEIDAAKSTLDPHYFDCEYMALDVDLSDSVWAFAFDAQKHIGEPVFNPEQMLFLSFDFNRNPICCSVIQHYDGCINVIETIKLPNSDIYKLCDHITVYYPNCLYMVTGDASGQSSTALVQDNINYYTVIMQKLRLSSQQLRVPLVNPKLADNQVLVNSLLANYKVQIHEEKAKGLIFDLKHVKMLADGSIEKGDRNDPSKQADALDTFRYWCNTFMSHFLKQ